VTRYVTVPNAITVVRTAVAMALAVAALMSASAALTVAAFLVYWTGDMLDGFFARLLDRETRFGAVLDICATGRAARCAWRRCWCCGPTWRCR
jgi:CDP-diacylglycerol--glycerol-3-phosphate 3-phosphatidyltransferase